MAKKVLKRVEVTKRIVGLRTGKERISKKEKQDLIKDRKEEIKKSDLPEDIKNSLLADIAVQEIDIEKAPEDPVFDQVIEATPKTGGETYIRLQKGVERANYKWNAPVKDYKNSISLDPSEEERWIKE